WRHAVEWMRYHFWLWHSAEEAKRYPWAAYDLAPYVKWDGKRKVVRFPNAPADAPHLPAGVEWTADESPVMWGDSAGAARHFVQRALDAMLRREAQVRVVWDAQAGGPAFRVAPSSLWGAVCLGFADAVAGDPDYSHCPSCGRWFLHVAGA